VRGEDNGEGGGARGGEDGKEGEDAEKELPRRGGGDRDRWISKGRTHYQAPPQLHEKPPV